MKRLLAAALFMAALSLAGPAAAQTARTYSLINGGTITPASPGYDPAGAPAYVGGTVAGQLDGASGTFTLWVSFRNTGCAVGAVCGGEIVPQYSSFAVTEGSGRKSVTTSGTIDSGTVTYRLTEYGRAEVVSVTASDNPNNLTVWRGKNKSRTRVGYGALDYGTTTGGSGTITLNFF